MSECLLLALDVGNTNITLGAFKGPEMMTHWRMATHRTMTADELALTVRDLFALADLDAPSRCLAGTVAASVVPTLDRAIREWGERYLDGRLLFVDRTVDLGIAIRHIPPEAVGADRLVNAVAAFEEYGGPCVVVDFGTATTFDVVDANGDYLGGAICPGIGISTEALFHNASKLPRVDIVAPTTAIGRTTADSLTSGVVYGYAAQVDGMVQRIRREMATEARVIATGGLADVICRETETAKLVDPWLTLKGLALIWRRVKGCA